jgi:ParB family chromosome partitioning protein
MQNEEQIRNAQEDGLGALEDKVKAIFLDRLAGGDWVRLNDLLLRVPEDLAQARFGLGNSALHADAVPIEYGRHRLTKDVVKALEADGQCEVQEEFGFDEVRLLKPREKSPEPELPFHPAPEAESEEAAGQPAPVDADGREVCTEETPCGGPEVQTIDQERTPVSEPTMTPRVVLIRIDLIDCGERHRKDMGDLGTLAASIRDLGLLQPVVVRQDGARYHLIAGQRRLCAKRMNDPSPDAMIEACPVDGLTDAAALLRAERDENTCRKDLTVSEAVALGMALEALEAKQAKQRQQQGGRAGGKASGKLPEASTGQTRDKVGEAVGMSGRTYDKAKEVVNAAQAEPERFGDLVEQMDATDKVHSAYQEMRERQGDSSMGRTTPTPKAGEEDRQKGEGDQTESGGKGAAQRKSSPRRRERSPAEDNLLAAAIAFGRAERAEKEAKAACKPSPKKQNGLLKKKQAARDRLCEAARQCYRQREDERERRRARRQARPKPPEPISAADATDASRDHLDATGTAATPGTEALDGALQQ